MSKSALEEVIGASPRGPDELPPVTVLPEDTPLITMIVLNVDESKLQTLQELGYVESYVVCPQLEDGMVMGDTGLVLGRKQKTDLLGVPLFYVSVLLSEGQLAALCEVNRSFRVVETAQLVAATVERVPDFARSPEGGPAHVFFGVPFGTEPPAS